MSRRKQISPYLNLHHYIFKYQLLFDSLKAFLDDSEGMIATANEKLNNEFRELQKEEDQLPDGVNAFDLIEADFLNLNEYDKILYTSIYISVYSKFEIELNHICKECQKNEDLQISASDLNSRNIIGKCKKYLRKVISVDLTSLNDKWEKITKYQRIRNLIVHSDGVSDNIDSDIKQFITDCQGISFNDNLKQIEITQHIFVLNFINLINDYLMSIIHEINKQKKTF